MTKGILGYVMDRTLAMSKGEGNELLQYLSIACMVSCVGVLLNSIVNYAIYRDVIYLGFNVFIFFVFLGVIILQRLSKFKAAKIFLCMGIPFWALASILCVGGYFGQGLAVGTSVAVTFLLFKRETALGRNLILFNIVSYVGSTLYMTSNTPIFVMEDYPTDEITVFFLCLFWLSIIFYFYEVRKLQLIKSLKISNKELKSKTGELERFTYIASHD